MRLAGRRPTSAADDALDGDWYRFTGASGTLITTSAPGWASCGSWGGGWLDGEYPSVADQKVTRTVCFQWKGEDCMFSVDIDVVDCGPHYLFRLPNVPQCESRCCGDDEE